MKPYRNSQNAESVGGFFPQVSVDFDQAGRSSPLRSSPQRGGEGLHRLAREDGEPGRMSPLRYSPQRGGEAFLRLAREDGEPLRMSPQQSAEPIHSGEREGRLSGQGSGDPFRRADREGGEPPGRSTPPHVFSQHFSPERPSEPFSGGATGREGRRTQQVQQRT